MAEQYQVISNPIVHVTVTSAANPNGCERRFQRDLTISALMGKLELVSGAMSSSMELEVYDKKEHLVCKLDNPDALLGSYHVDDGMRIHVIDKSGQGNQFSDVSQVEKFEISKEDYEKKTDSVRAFKQRMKMGQFAEVDTEEKKRKEEEKLKKEEEEKEKAASISVGDRCEVTVKGQPAKRGQVKFVGLTEFKPGFWVGVQYDEPVGKNDGSVQGVRYFECPPKYGGFVKPNQITVGDFPEEDFEMDDDEM